MKMEQTIQRLNIGLWLRNNSDIVSGTRYRRMHGEEGFASDSHEL